MVVDLRQVTKLLGSSIFWLGIIALVPAIFALTSGSAGFWEFAITAVIGTSWGAFFMF